MNNKQTIKYYEIVFALSLLFTVAAYLLVVISVFPGWELTVAIIFLAVSQLFAQLIFFLHLVEEANPRWNLFLVLSTISIIMIVIGGSLWIMNNLSYRHMSSPAETTHFILKDEGINK